MVLTLSDSGCFKETCGDHTRVAGRIQAELDVGGTKGLGEWQHRQSGQHYPFPLPIIFRLSIRVSKLTKSKNSVRQVPT